MARFFSSLRFRLLLLVLMAVVPALALVIYTASEQRQLAATQAQDNALRLARAAVTNQEQLIWGAQQLLIVLAQVPAVRGSDPAACSQVLENLLKHDPRYTSFSVVESDDSARCRAVPPNNATGYVIQSPALRDVVHQVRETGDLAGGRYGVGPFSGRGIVTFGYPIFDELNRVKSVVIASLDVAALNGLAAQALLPPGSTLTENDRNGTIVARFPDPGKWVGQVIPEASLRAIQGQAGEEGTVITTGEDGVSRLYAFTPLHHVPENDIYVSVGIPVAIAFAQVNQILGRNLLALGLVALLALTAAWVGGEWFIFRQVKDLSNVSERLANGDLNARTALRYGVDELGQLARAFDRMVSALARRETERQQAELLARRQAARAEALVRVANRLNAQLDLGSVLQTICDETAHALSVPAASVSLYDKDREVYVAAASYGLAPAVMDRLPPVPPTVFDASTLQTGAAVVVRDVRERSDWNGPGYAAANIRTVVAARMLRNGQLVGLLSVFTVGETREVSDDEQTLLNGFAAQAALAIANARLFKALQHEERARAELLHRVITAQEDERMRIARELHDETSQGLTALMTELATARLALHDDLLKADEYLQTTKALAEEMLDGIHRLVEDLRPSLLDLLGLVPAIAWYGDQRLSPVGITLRLADQSLPGRLSPSMETVLFRIVQEALTNVVRHAQASLVDVRLALQDGGLVLQVTDNGRGFDSALQSQTSSFGLRGMQERVSILGGAFSLQTARGQGTVLTVRVPLPREEVVHA